MCPQSRLRIPDGARPSGGAERAHSPDLFPGLPAGAPAVPPRRVTVAAPPPSWARLVLPTPAGSGQPRPRRSRAGPCFPSPRQTGKRPVPKYQFFISVLSGHPKDSRFHFAPSPSQVLLCTLKRRNLTWLHPRLEEMLYPKVSQNLETLICLCLGLAFQGYLAMYPGKGSSGTIPLRPENSFFTPP